MGVKEFKTPQTQKSIRFPSGEDIAVLIVSLLVGHAHLMMSLRQFVGRRQ